jgi:hypothetical protein
MRCKRLQTHRKAEARKGKYAGKKRAPEVIMQSPKRFIYRGEIEATQIPNKGVFV